jgi:hypothetical protein
MAYEPMTAAKLAEHETSRYGRNYAESDDGWSDMTAENRRGWHEVSGWGRKGWDLGDWPLVVIYTRERTLEPVPEQQFELMQIVEGDRTTYAFETAAERDAAIDYLFLWYAAGQSWAPLTYEDRAKLDAGELEVDAKFRGPYSRRDS